MRPLLLAPFLIAACSASGTAPGGAEPPQPPPRSGADPVFTAPNVWTERVDAAALHPQSKAMIDRLVAQGGFGGGHFQIDFSITVLDAGAATPRAPFAKGAGYYEPDCDAPANFPLPPGGAIEGAPGYACDPSAADCHLLVVDRAQGQLFEAFGATLDGAGRLSATCAIVWDTARSYPAALRGEQCTSADAAGLPIAPLLFSADEIAAGAVEHAIRFVLPNARMRALSYVRPATHGTRATSGPADAVPYGSRLRLRAAYPVASLAPAARVVATALQRYGMILADGGTVALTARDDRFTAAKWSDVGLDSHGLYAITAADFEVVDTGPVIPLTLACARIP